MFMCVCIHISYIIYIYIYIYTHIDIHIPLHGPALGCPRSPSHALADGLSEDQAISLHAHFDAVSSNNKCHCLSE